MQVLRRIAMVMAIAGAAIAMMVAAMTTVSVMGRAFFVYPIPGDVELTTLGIGAAISLCIPWCQYRGANILIDFFTQSCRPSTRVRLDGLGSICLAGFYMLLTWRTGVGAMAVKAADESSMILELPMWWTYAILVPGLAIATLIALGQGINQLRGHEPAGDAEGEVIHG